MASGLRWAVAKAFFEANGYWLGVTNPIVLARKYRRFFLETADKLCVLCHRSEWEGQPIPLVLDHINGNPEDWALLNLRLICGNCDMLLPTYKNRNRGNGRGYRRMRYTAGKTF